MGVRLSCAELLGTQNGSTLMTTSKPDVQALTDAEWREFQSIPEQGYSHRHWVDYKIQGRVDAHAATMPDREAVLVAVSLVARDGCGWAIYPIELQEMCESIADAVLALLNKEGEE